jgi:SAM-dependent methyltransferase
MSIEYYNKNAEMYIKDTVTVDMRKLYNVFEKYLNQGDTVLDIGCGSGRDGRYFLGKGYNVYAHDGSRAMVAYAKRFLGNRVALAMFDAFDPEALFGKKIIFDGLWACSSLLHVPENDLVNVLKRYLSFLVDQGVFFMSFKRREENHEKDGRIFTNFTKEKLDHLFDSIENISVLEFLETVDVREDRKNEGWISVVVRKE